VIDHCVINKKSEGCQEIKTFWKQAKSCGSSIILDFIPTVAIDNSKKYLESQNLQVESKFKLIVSSLPNADLILLTFRSSKFWKFLASEMIYHLEHYSIGGFYFGDVSSWDIAYPRDLNEFYRIDLDDSPHFHISAQLND
jgi:hypothetical protein